MRSGAAGLDTTGFGGLPARSIGDSSSSMRSVSSGGGGIGGGYTAPRKPTTTAGSSRTKSSVPTAAKRRSSSIKSDHSTSQARSASNRSTSFSRSHSRGGGGAKPGDRDRSTGKRSDHPAHANPRSATSASHHAPPQPYLAPPQAPRCVRVYVQNDGGAAAEAAPPPVPRAHKTYPATMAARDVVTDALVCLSADLVSGTPTTLVVVGAMAATEVLLGLPQLLHAEVGLALDNVQIRLAAYECGGGGDTTPTSASASPWATDLLQNIAIPAPPSGIRMYRHASAGATLPDLALRDVTTVDAYERAAAAARIRLREYTSQLTDEVNGVPAEGRNPYSHATAAARDGGSATTTTAHAADQTVIRVEITHDVPAGGSRFGATPGFAGGVEPPMQRRVTLTVVVIAEDGDAYTRLTDAAAIGAGVSHSGWDAACAEQAARAGDAAAAVLFDAISSPHAVHVLRTKSGGKAAVAAAGTTTTTTTTTATPLALYDLLSRVATMPGRAGGAGGAVVSSAAGGGGTKWRPPAAAAVLPTPPITPHDAEAAAIAALRRVEQHVIAAPCGAPQASSEAAAAWGVRHAGVAAGRSPVAVPASSPQRANIPDPDEAADSTAREVTRLAEANHELRVLLDRATKELAGQRASADAADAAADRYKRDLITARAEIEGLRATYATQQVTRDAAAAQLSTQLRDARREVAALTAARARSRSQSPGVGAAADGPYLYPGGGCGGGGGQHLSLTPYSDIPMTATNDSLGATRRMSDVMSELNLDLSTGVAEPRPVPAGTSSQVRATSGSSAPPSADDEDEGVRDLLAHLAAAQWRCRSAEDDVARYKAQLQKQETLAAKQRTDFEKELQKCAVEMKVAQVEARRAVRELELMRNARVGGGGAAGAPVDASRTSDPTATAAAAELAAAQSTCTDLRVEIMQLKKQVESAAVERRRWAEAKAAQETEKQALAKAAAEGAELVHKLVSRHAVYDGSLNTLTAWLYDLRLAKYVHIFETYNVHDVAGVARLSDKELENLGVTFLDRKKLQHALKSLPAPPRASAAQGLCAWVDRLHFRLTGAPAPTTPYQLNLATYETSPPRDEVARAARVAQALRTRAAAHSAR